jgi:hypothetical protein
MSNAIEVGKTYIINSTRKGIFTGVIASVDDTWASVLIINGHAKAMLDYNERGVGEVVTVRRSFCTFTEAREQ